MTTPPTISLLGPDRFAASLRSAGFTVPSHQSLKEAAFAAQAAMATTPVLMVHDEQEHPVPLPVIRQFRQRAVAHLLLGEPPAALGGDSDLAAISLPISLGTLADALGVEIATAKRGWLLGTDGGLTEVEAEPADDEDAWLSEFESEGTTEIVAATGWEDEVEEPVTIEAAPMIAEPVDFPSLEQEMAEAAQNETIEAAEPVEETPASMPARGWSLSEEPTFDEVLAADAPVEEPLVAAATVEASAVAVPAQAPVAPAPEPERIAPVAISPAAAAEVEIIAAPAPQFSREELLRMLEESGMRVQPVEEEDSPAADLLAIADRGRSDESRQSVRRNATILYVWAASGGVGKTSTTLCLAEIAAHAGLKVLVLDANRGQPDITKQLARRGSSASLATVHDAISGDVHDAVTPASRLNELRRASNATEIAFDVVLSPDYDVHNVALHDASLYRRIIEGLRHDYDLIVIDTQILDNDLSDLWTGLHMPMIGADAWSVGITDPTSAKQHDLRDQLRRLREQQLPTGRSMVIGTMFDEFDDEDTRTFERAFLPSKFLGATIMSPRFKQDMRAGSTVVTDDPLVTPVYRAVLAALFPLRQEFQPVPEPARRGWLSFGRRR